MAAGARRADPALARHRRARPARRRERGGAAGSPSCCCAPSRSSATWCRSSRSTSPAIPSRSRRRRRSRSSTPPAPLGPLELVSHGEHLCQSADLIARCPLGHRARPPALPPARRAARGGRAGPDPVAGALVGLRPLGARGAGGRRRGRAGRPTSWSRACKAAGELLARRGRRRRPDAVSRRHPRRRRTGSIELRTGRGRLPEPAPCRSDRDADVVPIASLSRPRSGEPDRRPDSRCLWRPASAPTTGSSASAAPAPAVARARWPAVARSRSPPLTGGGRRSASLCYRGRAALERAAAVRQQLAAELAGVPDLAAIRPLLQELLDLVPLALDES